MQPTVLLDRRGTPLPSLTHALPLAPITAFVGGGGKTSTILALGEELSRQGRSVIFTTTTHIRPAAPSGFRVVGVPLPSGKLGAPPDPDHLAEECDYLLIEADGSRSLPVKAPAPHEPVLTPGTGLVVAVQGLRGVGQPIGAVCHRPERVCALLNKTPEAVLTPADCARLLLSQQGLRKDVGSRPYAVVLNQADDRQRQQMGMDIAALLPDSIPCMLTAYGQKEYL
jgi:hypothetical protein